MMNCEWCGQAYCREQSDHKFKGMCQACTTRRRAYNRLRSKGKTDEHKRRLSSLVREYEDLAMLGYKVPTTITNIRR